MWVVVALLAVATALVLPACRGQTAGPSDIQMTMQVAPSPAAVGPAEITLALRGADGSPVLGATVDVEGTMNHAGMVPVRVRTEPLGEGRYATRDFHFTMAGDWIIIVQAALADGRKVERTFELKGVAGEGMGKPADPAGQMQH
ncbi:MAG: FixH family protein [Chloroflexi bacterium]|nr:FixH family protein [Chloroflexota bacterium]